MTEVLNENQVADNYNKLLSFIEDSFSGDRKEKLLKFYEDFADRIAIAPASNRIFFHSCYTGGYVVHVLNVINFSQRISKLWSSEFPIADYTEEELNFVALNHDLGKIGDLENEYYVPMENDWKIRNGYMYDFNNELPYMRVQDRSLYLLQSYGIEISQNEYLGILLHDGMFEEGNKKYYQSYEVKFNLRTMLPYLVHFADLMALRKEQGEWLQTPDGKKYLSNGKLPSKSGLSPHKKTKMKKVEDVLSKENKDFDIDSFEKLFPNTEDK